MASSATGSTSNTSKSITAQANTLWQKQPKANAEFFALTYGALVAELVRDLEDSSSVEKELDRMGHSMGIRCIEEVLAKAPELRVTVFKDTHNVVKMAFKLFLGLTVDVVATDENVYTIKYPENPLTIFVELPPDRQDLEYSQMLAGMVRGMLEMLQFECDCKMSENNEISVSLRQVMQDGAGEEYQEE
jgi:hypothetical protein